MGQGLFLRCVQFLGDVDTELLCGCMRAMKRNMVSRSLLPEQFILQHLEHGKAPFCNVKYKLLSPLIFTRRKNNQFLTLVGFDIKAMKSYASMSSKQMQVN